MYASQWWFLRTAWLSLFNRTWSIWFGWQYPKYFEFVTFWSIVNTWAACTIYPVLATTAKALKSITSQRIMVCVCDAQLFVGFGSFDQSSYQISMNQKWHTDNGECDLLCGCRVFTAFNYRLCIWHVLLKCERAFIRIALQQQKKYFPVKIRCGKQLVLCICHFACQFAVKIARIMTLLKAQVGSNIPLCARTNGLWQPKVAGHKERNRLQNQFLKRVQRRVFIKHVDGLYER